MSSAADFKLLVSNAIATRVKKQTNKSLSLNDLRKIKRILIILRMRTITNLI